MKIHRKIDQLWSKAFYGMRSRCNNPNMFRYESYGGRGIKCDLGFWDMGVLYWRDKADKMQQPTIDRIDNSGDYTFQNCRFIERKENTGRARKGNPWTQARWDAQEKRRQLCVIG